MEHAREGADKRGFAQAGHSFQQHVAARDHADQNGLDDVSLPDDHFPDFFTNSVEVTSDAIHCHEIASDSRWPSIHLVKSYLNYDGKTMLAGSTPLRSQS